MNILNTLKLLGCKVKVTRYRLVNYEVWGEKELTFWPDRSTVFNSYRYEAKGGVTIVCIDDTNNERYVGYSVCSNKDNFDKKIGVRIALDRLQKVSKDTKNIKINKKVELAIFPNFVERNGCIK